MAHNALKLVEPQHSYDCGQQALSAILEFEMLTISNPSLLTKATAETQNWFFQTAAPILAHAMAENQTYPITEICIYPWVHDPNMPIIKDPIKEDSDRVPDGWTVYNKHQAPHDESGETEFTTREAAFREAIRRSEKFNAPINSI